MRIVCPVCYAVHELDALLADEDARQALMTLSGLPGGLARPAVLYLGCFRPAKRALSWARFRRLLDEIAGMIDAGSIRRRGRAWPVSAEQWGEAFRAVVERRDAGALELPLKGHGYLLEVAMGVANRAEAAEEREVEEVRRARGGTGPSDASHLIDHARAYGQLLAEARELGVELDERGAVRPMPAMAAAVRRARAGGGSP